MHTMIRIQDALTRPLWAALLVGSVVVVAGCSSPPAVDPNSAAAVDQLYADAKDDLSSGSFDRAIKTLERVEGRAAGTLLAQQATLDMAYAQYRTGERIFHQKFGYGRIVSIEGNKLLVDFEKAGSKRVMDGFVSRA